MPTVIEGTTGTSIAGNAVVEGNLTVTGTLIGGVPPGAVFYFAASTAPTGYLVANGAAISRTTYAALFAVVGTTYGAGDGTTTFNLPDLRGEFIRSWDGGRGIDSGRAFASSQLDAFQGHRHSWRQYPATGGGSGVTPLAQSSSSNLNNAIVADPITDGTNGTPRTAAETRPRNIALLACIKF